MQLKRLHSSCIANRLYFCARVCVRVRVRLPLCCLYLEINVGRHLLWHNCIFWIQDSGSGYAFQLSICLRMQVTFLVFVSIVCIYSILYWFIQSVFWHTLVCPLNIFNAIILSLYSEFYVYSIRCKCCCRCGCSFLCPLVCIRRWIQKSLLFLFFISFEVISMAWAALRIRIMSFEIGFLKWIGEH